MCALILLKVLATLSQCDMEGAEKMCSFLVARALGAASKRMTEPLPKYSSLSAASGEVDATYDSGSAKCQHPAPKAL